MPAAGHTSLRCSNAETWGSSTTAEKNGPWQEKRKGMNHHPQWLDRKTTRSYFRTQSEGLTWILWQCKVYIRSALTPQSPQHFSPLLTLLCAVTLGQHLKTIYCQCYISFFSAWFHQTFFSNFTTATTTPDFTGNRKLWMFQRQQMQKKGLI